MTVGEQRLLGCVADPAHSFGNHDVHTRAEVERCDAEVRELQKLEQKGWIVLQWSHMTHHGEMYAAAPLITAEGRRALRAAVIRSGKQRRQRVCLLQRRGRPQDNLAVGGHDLEHRVGKGDQPATLPAAHVTLFPRHLVEPTLR
jgi:hypothetical protein